MIDEDEKWWLAVKELAEMNHHERVAQTPNRIEYAIKRFTEEGIAYRLKNKETGHFHVLDKDGNLFQFWAGTGKIYFDKKTKDACGFKSFYKDYRGIENCIRIVKHFDREERKNEKI